MKKMTEDDLRDLQSTIDNEGFCYTFVDYSEFSEIEDDEFHRLRKRLIKAYKKLEEYIISLIEEK